MWCTVHRDIPRKKLLEWGFKHFEGLFGHIYVDRKRDKTKCTAHFTHIGEERDENKKNSPVVVMKINESSTGSFRISWSETSHCRLMSLGDKAADCPPPPPLRPKKFRDIVTPGSRLLPSERRLFPKTSCWTALSQLSLPQVHLVTHHLFPPKLTENLTLH